MKRMATCVQVGEGRGREERDTKEHGWSVEVSSGSGLVSLQSTTFFPITLSFLFLISSFEFYINFSKFVEHVSWVDSRSLMFEIFLYQNLCQFYTISQLTLF